MSNKKTINFKNVRGFNTRGKAFKIYQAFSEASNALDITIHDLNPVTILDTGSNLTILDPNNLKSFEYVLNGRPPVTTSSDPAPFLVEDTNQKFFALYQFSIGFDEFLPKRNALEINVKPLPKGSNNPIGELEFFKEVEENITSVRLDRPGLQDTADKVLWDKISENMLYFSEYEKFIDTIICGPDTNPNIKYRGQNFDNVPSNYRPISKVRSPFIKSEEYNLIKFATDFYMLAKFGLDTRQLNGYATQKTGYRLPYYDIIVDRIKDNPEIADILSKPGDKILNFPTDINQQIESDCEERAFERLYNPIMIELIWNYWMEQGMLVQTLNVINLHFQNIKTTKHPSPLDRLHTDPLRPLNHILWGYIQDEQHRLSLPRRLGEYDHEYGLTLTGRAVPYFNAADTRVKFLEAFHNLLNLTFIYSKESDDTTYIADAFPILTALREVHLLLAEGNHNAYGDLTWTARQEMMMQQYILSRSEMREFLGGRVMVPYPETWMDRVDTMRHIMNWGATSILHFYELALHGEQVLLSIRYGNWSDATLDRTDAANWAQKFRNSIYRYIHAYRTVTGVDLSAEKIQASNVFALQPAYLMQQRLLEEKQPSSFYLQQRMLLGRNRKAS